MYINTNSTHPEPCCHSDSE